MTQFRQSQQCITVKSGAVGKEGKSCDQSLYDDQS